MRTSRMALCAVAVLTVALLAPLVPSARGAVTSAIWTNTTFTGTDPFLGVAVNAYAAGSTATLQILVTDTVGGAYINVTGAKLMMDWNGNYTTTNSLKIPLNTQASFSLTFPVPQTSTASNLVAHNCVLTCLTVNYTNAAGAKNQFFFNPLLTDMAVYSSDQASAMSVFRQLGFLATSSGTVCSSFKTPTASSACGQAVQQFNLGTSLYSTGNFAGANTAFQSALTNWNNAINNENSAGGGLTLGSTVGGWGSLLLGIGAVVVGAAAIIYAIRRPKELRAAAAATR